MPAIRTEALTKDYSTGFWRPRPSRALENLTLEIAPGEIFGFLGPNGAGKTTTLKLLMQLIFPTSGRAEILGRPVGDVGVKRRLGYLPENPYFYDNLTAEELLVYYARVFGHHGSEAARRAGELLDLVGIGGERALQLRKFSKGMLQRIGLAQALLNDPDVVFLDEPMSGLDPLGRRDVRELILRLRERGCTVFFSSHILSDAESLCSRVAILSAGRLIATGTVSELLAFGVGGWELVMTNLAAATVARLGLRIARATEIAEGHYALELPIDAAPDGLLRELTAAGAALVSLNPIRPTLEDVFIKKVGGARERATFHHGAHRDHREKT
ncbi:MAG: ABC transporter ATP-binding protein [Acidobacteria bacterium]|nr:ABC transporter ATP-binding protein [Acidobacteriota bacterium]